MTDREKVALCPWCGSEPVVRPNVGTQIRYAMCEKKGCPLCQQHTIFTLEEWNDRADALRPETQGVKAKPLEWVEAGSYGHLFAGPYEISFSGNKRRIGLHYHYIREGRQDDERLFSGENTEGAVERLKASAEEHNNIRTLSALDRPEAQDGVEQTLTEGNGARQ